MKLDFVGGHAQQNGEQLNNLLKTLDGYYKNSNLKNTPMPNKGEFVGYFIIFQVGGSWICGWNLGSDVCTVS